MKCEICKKADAETALVRETDGGEEEELYVCKACAAAERKRRQSKSQRTRKVTGLPPGMSMSVTEITPSEDGEEGDEPPPIVGAIMSAFQEMVGDIEKATGDEQVQKKKKAPDLHDFPVQRVDAEYRFGARLHLEGLSLIGEREAVGRALRALRMEMGGIEADGLHEAGHAYVVRYAGSAERARRVVTELVEQERNARVRLLEEMPRVLSDSLCRALAILKNCRLLSPAELFDLLSPLRLAALADLLDGITLREIEALAAGLDLTGSEDRLEPEERDRIDAERADEMNRLFEDVMLNERAEGKEL